MAIQIGMQRVNGRFAFSQGKRMLLGVVAALADFNGDGHLDVFVTISPDGEPYVAMDVLLVGVDSYQVWQGDSAGGWTAVTVDPQQYRSKSELAEESP